MPESSGWRAVGVLKSFYSYLALTIIHFAVNTGSNLPALGSCLLDTSQTVTHVTLLSALTERCKAQICIDNAGCE